MHSVAGAALDLAGLGNSLLIPGSAFDLHASKQVKAEAPLWALMAKEAVLHPLWRLPFTFPCRGEGMCHQPVLMSSDCKATSPSFTPQVLDNHKCAKDRDNSVS